VDRVALLEQNFAHLDRPDVPVPCEQLHLLVSFENNAGSSPSSRGLGNSLLLIGRTLTSD
jgi:hypothetical protein